MMKGGNDGISSMQEVELSKEESEVTKQLTSDPTTKSLLDPSTR